jgi:TetR/AcrR family transcriptional regulator, mexCD-oprJ operon repressor
MYHQEMFASNIDAAATLTFMPATPTLRDRIAAGILDTAAAVLAGRGESASMAEIADAAGVSRATLYRYFPTRDALLNALAEAASAELRGRIADAELDTIPVPEAIGRLTRGFVLTGSKYVALAHSGHKPPDADQTQQDLAEPVYRLLRRGIADGTLRSDLAPEVLVQIFSSLLETAIRISGPGGTGAEKASAAIISVFLDGSRPRPPHPNSGPASSSPADAQ